MNYVGSFVIQGFHTFEFHTHNISSPSFYQSPKIAHRMRNIPILIHSMYSEKVSRSPRKGWWIEKKAMLESSQPTFVVCLSSPKLPFDLLIVWSSHSITILYASFLYYSLSCSLSKFFHFTKNSFQFIVKQMCGHQAINSQKKYLHNIFFA